ncbi:MAG: DUF3667 domain-containing protein [Bacteroidetes bacterium]|nr:DUF3667 domain-containing protein [Bacteroidota bacterium]
MEKCLNCGTKLMGKFCYHCGQEKIVDDSNMKALLKDFFRNSFRWESTYFATIKKLFTAPGIFIKNYIEGKRKPYIKPVTFFILVVSFYIITFHTFSENDFSYMSRTFLGETSKEIIILGVSVAEFQHFITNKMNYMIFIQPVFYAYFFTLFFRKPKIKIAESFIFYFYIMGAGFLIAALFIFLSLINSNIWNLRFFPMAVFEIYAMIQFTQSKTASGILKSAAVLLLGSVSYIITASAIVIGYLKLTH